MTDYRIPFNRSSLLGREQEYIAEAMRIGQVAGDQAFTKRCHALLERETGAAKALLTTSCTHALEMSAILLDLRPGDEVILPSFTFVSTANAFVLRGATPVFIDVRPDTLNLDERLIERAVTPRTKAIVPVHYAGVACEMDAILDVATSHRLAVVEDNAHGIFGAYRGKPLGSFGVLATLSFHETKNYTCGEGGALLINDPNLIERAEIVREKGTNRARFFRGEVDKYTWVDVGSSYLMSDVLAAFLLGQLEMWQAVRERRRAIWDNYNASLRDWAAARGVRIPVVPSHCQQSYHMYYLLLPTSAAREATIAQLRRQGILSVFHYLPLHLSPMGRSLGGRDGQCPVTEDVSGRLLRLPFYNSLTPEDQTTVIQALRGVRW